MTLTMSQERLRNDFFRHPTPSELGVCCCEKASMIPERVSRMLLFLNLDVGGTGQPSRVCPFSAGLGAFCPISVNFRELWHRRCF